MLVTRHGPPPEVDLDSELASNNPGTGMEIRKVLDIEHRLDPDLDGDDL